MSPSYGKVDIVYRMESLALAFKFKKPMDVFYIDLSDITSEHD